VRHVPYKGGAPALVDLMLLAVGSAQRCTFSPIRRPSPRARCRDSISLQGMDCSPGKDPTSGDRRGEHKLNAARKTSACRTEREKIYTFFQQRGAAEFFFCNSLTLRASQCILCAGRNFQPF